MPGPADTARVRPADINMGVSMAKSLRCRLGWHKWIKRNVDGGGQYLVCVRCGKEDHGTLSTPGAMGGGF
jgi:hypothetical protein